MIGATVLQIVARDRGNDDVLQIHPLHCLGDALWLVVFQREWFRCCDCAKSACPRATIASDHESSGTLAPAFPAIRALRAFANRVQSQIGNQCFGRKENRIRGQPDFDPGRFLRLVKGWIDLRAGHFGQSYNVRKVTKVKSESINIWLQPGVAGM